MEEKQNNTEEMAKVWISILKAVQQQGLSFMLMVAIAYYFQMQNNNLQAKVDQCNASQMELYREHAKHMEKAIERNTMAFENFSVYLRDQVK